MDESCNGELVGPGQCRLDIHPVVVVRSGDPSSGGLPYTGAEITLLTGFGLMLVMAGLVLVLFVKKSRKLAR